MSYNTDHLRTAGKITVYTSLLGVLVFMLVFIFNLGTTEIKEVDAQAQYATTSVTVVNTPPFFIIEAYENPASATTSPTNVGDTVTWVAIADDANSEPYYLLICSDNATPTANSGAAPECDPGAIQWAVTGTTTAATQASAATTTTAAAPFSGEAFNWYAWVCDDNAVTPRCNATSTQGHFGPSATSSSPFEVNHRPAFTFFVEGNPSGYDPGATAIFYSTSSDADTSGSQDTVRLFVCSTNSFNIATDQCDATTLASTTAPGSAANATATYSVPLPLIDQDYGAWGFVIDNHGFEAQGGAQGTDTTLTVNNVAPTVTAVSLNGGLDMVIANAATQTPGFTLQFTADDNNTCLNSGATAEITDYTLSVYRSGTGVSSTTCTTVAGDYNANNCYPSEVGVTVWNLSCTASSTACTGAPSDTDTVYDCTFPLWYIADPTDGNASTTQYPGDDWRAQVQAIDDDFATGTLSESTAGQVDVTSLLAFALNTPTIPYGSLEPGQQTDPLAATTTIASTGNVGLDKTASGTSMCTNYTTNSPCGNSATSTIPESEQRFATSAVAYAAATALSSTTGQEIEINVFKSTSTSSPATANAYWGIRVPATITFAGDYTGENVFIANVGEPVDWD